LYYDTTEKKIKVYSDSAWSDLGGGWDGVLPSYTTSQRNDLSLVDGLIVFNTSDNAVQIYVSGVWRNISGKLSSGIVCTLDGDCDSTHCVDGVCCDTTCEGNCNRCNVPGSEGICTDTNLDCTGNCDVCSSGNCVASAGLCTGNCDICSEVSATEFNCEASNALCSNTISSCYCSGSGTVFNCQSCPSSPYPSNCGYATCSNYTCGVQGVAAGHSGSISGQTVYCDEHNRLWTPTQSGTYTWANALSKCSGLNYAGLTDWVLPSCSSKTKDSNCYLYQLAIDACGSCNNCAPSWDTAAQLSCYYSSTETSDGAYAIKVCFNTAYIGSSAKDYLRYVRCVHGQ